MEESRARRVVDALRELRVDAQLERDGVLVGFVPALPGDLDGAALVEAVARTDYDAPAGARRERPLPVGSPLPVRRGLFARVRPGLRW